jgi:ribonuclease HII
VSLAVVDLLRHERELLARGEVVAGVDEVGRGALAGPLTVGVVVITSLTPPPDRLTDSKLLTSAQREALEVPLRDWAFDWSLGSVSAKEIDDWGLRLALAVAATRALDGLAVRPTFALLDGSFNLLRAPLDVPFGVAPPPELRYADLAHQTVVKGDASVLAKVQRDRVMVELDQQFGVFDWARNKGYGAPVHLEALRRHGPSDQHRKSWKLPSLEARVGPIVAAS